MNIELYREHCLSKKGVSESIPFPSLPDVLVFKVKGKMFTSAHIDQFDGFSFKCNPATIDNLRAKYLLLPDYI